MSAVAGSSGAAAWQPVIRGLCIALLGAGLAVWMGTPLPWLLGPLFLTAATRVAGMPTRCPAPFNKFGRWVIGLSLGLYFSAEVMQSLAQHWGLILAGILYAQVLAVIGCWFYHRVGGLDVGTAWFSSAIGTASEIVNMAHRHGTRADHVATVHSVRVLLVVALVPFGVQWLGGDASHLQGAVRDVHWSSLLPLMLGSLVSVWFFLRVRLPNAWLLGALLFVAAVNLLQLLPHTDLPRWVSWAGQLCIGWSFGDRYRPDFLRGAPRLLSAACVFTLASIALTVGLGEVLSPLVGLPAPSLILGLMPGGIAEMTLTARALELGVAMVTAMQVARMLSVVFSTPAIYRRFIQAREGDRASGAQESNPPV